MDNEASKLDFYTIYTDFQCLLIAQLNKMDYSGISAIQFNIVEYLYRNGQSTSSELAKKFFVSQPAISRQLTSLLDKKMLIQKQDRLDRRIFFLEVTGKGKQLVIDSENIRKTMSSKITHILDAGELAQFAKSLSKIVQNIEI